MPKCTERLFGDPRPVTVALKRTVRIGCPRLAGADHELALVQVRELVVEARRRDVPIRGLRMQARLRSAFSIGHHVSRPVDAEILAREMIGHGRPSGVDVWLNGKLGRQSDDDGLREPRVFVQRVQKPVDSTLRRQQAVAKVMSGGKEIGRRLAEP
jgi:hypothetical protein